jgi:hypothetical protein
MLLQIPQPYCYHLPPPGLETLMIYHTRRRDNLQSPVGVSEIGSISKDQVVDSEASAQRDAYPTMTQLDIQGISGKASARSLT